MNLVYVVQVSLTCCSLQDAANLDMLFQERQILLVKTETTLESVSMQDQFYNENNSIFYFYHVHVYSH